MKPDTDQMADTDKGRFSVTIVDTGERYDCAGGMHLLKAMLSLGRKGIPSGCHGGGCGVCKIKVEQGDFEASLMSREHVSEGEEKDNVVLACRTFPRSDIALRVLGKMHKSVVRRYGLV